MRSCFCFDLFKSAALCLPTTAVNLELKVDCWYNTKLITQVEFETGN